MKNRQTLGAVAAGYGASVAAWPQIPAPEWMGDDLLGPGLGRVFIVFLLPTAATAIWLLLSNLQRHDPVQPGDELSGETREAIVSRLILFVVVLHVIMLSGLVGPGGWIPRVLPALGGFTLIGIGNLLPRTRPNAVIGIRTARALRDRRVWIRLHRNAGWISVLIGFFVVLGAFFPEGAGRDVLILVPLVMVLFLFTFPGRRTGA